MINSLSQTAAKRVQATGEKCHGHSGISIGPGAVKSSSYQSVDQAAAAYKPLLDPLFNFGSSV